MRFTCCQDVVSPHVHVHGLQQQHGDDLGPVPHGCVVEERQAVLVLLAKSRRGHLATQSLEDGHQAPL